MNRLEERLQYTFRDKKLLQQALTHSSYANEKLHDVLQSYERLEFLGDAILDFLAADYLYKRFADMPEGQLTRLRADLVCEKALAAVARQLDLGSFLLLGHGGEQDGGRQRDSILADAVEAIVAAVYLDSDLSCAAALAQRLILLDIRPASSYGEDWKTQLQELVQRRKNQSIEYRLLSQTGPDHNKTFTMELRINDEPVGQGTGNSKKRAEQEAAREAIAKLFPHALR